MLKSWRSSLQRRHCLEAIGLMPLACTLSWNAVFLRESHIARTSMCDEWLFGPSSQEDLVMYVYHGVSCTLFRVSRHMMFSTVPNMDLITAPFVVFCRHFALVFDF